MLLPMRPGKDLRCRRLRVAASAPAHWSVRLLHHRPDCLQLFEQLLLLHGFTAGANYFVLKKVSP